MRSVFLSNTKIIDATIDAFVGLQKIKLLLIHKLFIHQKHNHMYNIIK